MMRAIVWTEYRPPDVLQLQEVERPTPKDNEVLIRVYATTVTTGDCEQRSLRLPIRYALPMRALAGFKRPERVTVLGMDFAGEIESVGKDIERFGSLHTIELSVYIEGIGGVPFEKTWYLKSTDMNYLLKVLYCF